MAARVVAAVDLGASSGRVMAGLVEGESIRLELVHRFPNDVVERGGHLRWDIETLWSQVQHGIGLLAARYPQVESIGIDTWGVDYGLLDADGDLLADPVSYRDGRTVGVVDQVHRIVSPDELFALNGLQFLPFTTLYQLAVEQRGPHWERVAHVVLLPDLLAYWLTGQLRTERTNASTTGLVDIANGMWSAELLDRLGIAPELLASLQSPGEVRGAVHPHQCAQLGLRESTVVTTVGSHDTASAVAALPASSPDFAYISSGTWSLVGLELGAPVVTRAARLANFTNEAGIDGSTRFLRNVGGLWLLQECLRTWREEGNQPDLEALLADAAALPADGPQIDVDDSGLIAPGDMPDRIAAAVAAKGSAAPSSPAQVVRCIIESLAAAYARTINEASRLAGHRVEHVHIVGGGSQNALLCQRTADQTGHPVIAGPVEATALGNVLVQARALGLVDASFSKTRAIAAGFQLHHYGPR